MLDPTTLLLSTTAIILMEDHKAYAIKLFLPFSLKAQRSKAKLLSLRA